MVFKKGQIANPTGKNGGNPKLIKQAIMMELKAAGADLPELRQIARKTIELAKDGNEPARTFLADRLDGKVSQGLVGAEDTDAIQVHHTIIRKIIEPKG